MTVNALVVVPLDLSAGTAIVLDGTEWIVERAEPQYGRAVLVSAGYIVAAKAVSAASIGDAYGLLTVQDDDV